MLSWEKLCREWSGIGNAAVPCRIGKALFCVA